MSARTILESISEETGVSWNEDSMIEILCDYIDKQGSDDAFEDFVQRRADEELAEARACEVDEAEAAEESYEEDDIIPAGSRLPFVQTGMIVHPDGCLECGGEGSPTWCSAIVSEISNSGPGTDLVAKLDYRGIKREQLCSDLRRHFRLARDFDSSKTYTGRWGRIPRGDVWPTAEVEEGV